MNKLKEKIVVITGAGGVICSTLAKAIASKGAKVMLLDLNYDSAKLVSDEINKKGYISKAYKANVLDKESLLKVKEEINKEFGKVDILINGAGGNNPKATTNNEYHLDSELLDKSFFDLDPKGVEFVFNLNFLGTFIPTQVFALDMVGKSDSSILNISSMNAYHPLTKIPAYSGAKAAVSNFTEWLSVHFSKVGIRVNAIAPGFFVTNQNKNLLFDSDGNPTPRTKKILSQTPMGRFGEVSELVDATLFLIDPVKASFITGVVLPIDGGFNAYSGV